MAMYTQEEKEKVLALANAGWSITDIVNETQVSRPTVYRWLSESVIVRENENEQTDTFEIRENLSQNDQGMYNSPSYEEDYEEEVFNEGTYEEDWQDDQPQATHSDEQFSSQNHLITGNKIPQNSYNSSSRQHPARKEQTAFDPEVEKLRLKLQYKLEFEKLRQEGKALELEEQKLRLEEMELKIREQQLRQQDQKQKQEELKQAKAQDQVKQKLLAAIKLEIHALRQKSEMIKFSEDELEKYYEDLDKLQKQTEEVADKQDENHKSWQVWNSLEIIIGALEKALDQINRSFFKDTTKINWNKEEEEALQDLIDLYSLNQPY